MELTKTQLIGINLLLREKGRLDAQIREFLLNAVEENGGDTTKKWQFDGKRLTEANASN